MRDAPLCRKPLSPRTFRVAVMTARAMPSRSRASRPAPTRRQPAVNAGSMLRIGARLGLSGCQQETCVPMQAYEARLSLTQRSSTNRQGSRRPAVAACSYWSLSCPRGAGIGRSPGESRLILLPSLAAPTTTLHTEAMMKSYTKVALGLFAVGVMCTGMIGPVLGASPTKPAISEEASAAMQAMGQSLLAKQLSFQARTLRVYADTDGRFLHIGHTLKVLVRRPDRMRAEVAGDDGENDLFYDGKTLVLYGPAKKEYVSIPVPDTIEGMLKEGAEKIGIDFPLADFLSPAPHKSVMSGVTDARVVNVVTIDGAPARHMTLFQPPGLELELWLTKNEQSLPERLFITYRSIPGQPTFIASFSDWNLSAPATDADFEFHPPEGATKVELKAPAPPSPAKAKGVTP